MTATNPIKSFVVTTTGQASQNVVLELYSSAGSLKGRTTELADSAGRVKIDLANVSSTWAVGDVIIVKQQGAVYVGGGSGTVASTDAGGKTISLTTAVIAFPGLSM